MLLPPVGAAFDYQLGGAYDPPSGVTVVARDSTASPAGAGYDICYVNGFQTQPGEGDSWLAASDGALVLHDASGEPFIDPGWPDEYILDTSTAASRDGIVARMRPVIEGCADSGFDAVEIDNLDTYSRSDGALTIEDNIALAAAYASVAHSAGLAIAQKNGAGNSARFKDEVGFDFVVAEECMRFEECDDYLDAYDGMVFDIEYTDDEPTGGFAAACSAAGRPASMILRDHSLSAVGSSEYAYASC